MRNQRSGSTLTLSRHLGSGRFLLQSRHVLTLSLILFVFLTKRTRRFLLRPPSWIGKVSSPKSPCSNPKFNFVSSRHLGSGRFLVVLLLTLLMILLASNPKLTRKKKKEMRQPGFEPGKFRRR